MDSFLGNKAAEVMKEVMDDYGIAPGELNERINETLQLINEMEPVVVGMAETSEDLEEDIGELHSQMEDFNGNSEEMVDAMNNLAGTLENFNDMMEGLEEVDE